MNLTEIRTRIRELPLVTHVAIREKSGNFSPVHVDVKSAFGRPAQLRLLAEGINALLPPDVSCIAACGYGGVPLAVAVVLVRNCRLTLIREQVKSHGKRTLFEGHTPKVGDIVVVIDDKVVTGVSIRSTVATVRATGATVVAAVVVVDLRKAEERDSFVTGVLSGEDLGL
jgi:orotate phosphoribosyltransferase